MKSKEEIGEYILGEVKDVTDGTLNRLIDESILEVLISWLKSHEDDIAMEINDFGELKPIFKALFMEDAQERIL